MSGHSKWNNIKRKKEATDAVKAKIFTKIGREMIVCIKEVLNKVMIREIEYAKLYIPASLFPTIDRIMILSALLKIT